MTKTRVWLQGAGLAMLYLLPPFAEFLSPARRNFYHQLLPVTTLTRGMLIDVLLLGLLAGAGFVVLNSFTPRVRNFLWLPVLSAASWIVARDISTSLSNPVMRGHLLALTPYVPLAVLVLAISLLLLAPRIYSYFVRGAAVILAAAGIALVLVILPQLVIACFSRVPREQSSFARPVNEGWKPGELRVVWILFDELSYRQALERRQPGIDLPAFTKLAAQSVTFSQLRPVGYETERIIPSLLLGRPVADVSGDANGNLLLRYASDKTWEYFDQDATMFAAAQRQGWGTGIAGWYNPYCRILNRVLDHCYWTFNQSVAGELFSRLSSRQSTWQNARDGLPLAARFQRLWHHSPPNQALHADYRNLLNAGEALIRDPDIRLAFIHMPVPHPPGLFRNPSVPGEEGFDYLGNLLLADRALAKFLGSIATGPAAANTVVIVSSDHSWRVPLWRGEANWTQAEERATDGGVFDQRPVLMVRFPGQNTPEHVDHPQSEMIVHDLLLDLIAGRIRTSQDWLATLPGRMPAINQAD